MIINENKKDLLVIIDTFLLSQVVIISFCDQVSHWYCQEFKGIIIKMSSDFLLVFQAQSPIWDRMFMKARSYFILKIHKGMFWKLYKSLILNVSPSMYMLFILS